MTNIRKKMMRPILLEIVTKVITTFDHCRHCEILFDEAGIDQKFHQREMDEYPLDLKEEFAKLSDWIRELNRLYKHRLLINLIDAQSLWGIFKSLRYRIRSYPTFIVEGKETYAGWDKNQLEALLDKYIKTSLLPKQRRVQPTLS
jgi:histone acetyltransferase (RNA polymerase elongator complex component)